MNEHTLSTILAISSINKMIVNLGQKMRTCTSSCSFKAKNVFFQKLFLVLMKLFLVLKKLRCYTFCVNAKKRLEITLYLDVWHDDL